MKTLHLSIIVGIAITVMLTFTYVILTAPHSTGPRGAMSPQMYNITNLSTIIIPKDSENQDSGKNYEPQFLVVVLGVNNTVQWINQADVGNTVVADNYDDPDFANATRSQSEGYMHIKLTNFLNPGSSFNFTFSKVGEFGYHGEPHPWLHGRVLVLPQSTENATQTVSLNTSSTIPGPCEVFRLPCPNNPNFTAQKMGANIYIEKVTANGVDNYAIIHNSSVCVYPPSYSGSCANPDDLAILRLVGVDTSIPQQDVNISIKGLESTYVIGKSIDFGIEVKGYGNCDVPSVLVSTEGYIKWQSKMSVVSCPPGMGEMDRNYSLEDLGGSFSLNQTGTYTVHVGYDSNSTEMQFNVTSSEGTSQSNMTNTKTSNPLGVAALIEFVPINMNLVTGPDYHFYLKINSNSTAYLLGYNICGEDLCVKKDNLSILLPANNIMISNYTNIGLSENSKWKYGDSADIQLEISPTPDNKTAYLLNFENSTIVP